LLASRVAMHIPDGFLSVWLSLALWVSAVVILGYALRRTNRALGERHVPLMGVLSAAIFAGQMLNFSVTGGTSGHLIGAALATALLGPWASIIVMSCVVAVQALVFQDGGLLALGANLVNMAVIGVAVAHFAYTTSQRLFQRKPWMLTASAFVAGWLSVFVASLACALELALSGTSPANIAVPAMAGVHALIGIGEGLITAGALLFVQAVRPDLVQNRASTSSTTGNETRAVWVGGLAIAVILTLIAPWASSHPDGLEWVAEQHGFLGNARGPLYQIIPDYLVPGIADERVATVLAGIIGVVIVSVTAFSVGSSRRRRNTTGDATA